MNDCLHEFSCLEEDYSDAHTIRYKYECNICGEIRNEYQSKETGELLDEYEILKSKTANYMCPRCYSFDVQVINQDELRQDIIQCSNCNVQFMEYEG